MYFQRITLIIAALFLFAVSTNCQTKQKLNIKEATIFLRGAELTSTAPISLHKGENEILFTNVASGINTSSVVINASNGVVVEAVTFQNNYLAAESHSPHVAAINDSIVALQELKLVIGTKIAVVNEQISVLHDNRQISGSNNGLSVAELSKMLDLVNNKMDALLTQKYKHELAQRKIDEQIGKLRQQIDEEQKPVVQPGGQLLVKFYSEAATTTVAIVTYVVPNAGWTPSYDIMANEANDPVTLLYKANVFQNSGIKWDNVKLSISTANPSEGVQAPVLAPWYLAFTPPPQPVAYARPLTNNQNSGRTVLTSDEIRTLPTTQISDMVGLEPGIYQAQRGRGVSVGGARTNGTLYIIDGVQVHNIGETSLDNYVTVDNSGINTTFDIDIPYSIPDDGKYHLVAIKKHLIPATYRYYAVPKLDKDAFLQAEITQWENLDLLPGQTNIFYEGSYVGQGYLDVRSTKDTITISLGRDKKIVVKREQDKKRRSVKDIGTNVRETVAYTITVRNTRKQKIHMVLYDQLPVSNDKDIVIEDVDTGKSDQNTTTGIMKWTLDPEPNDTKTMSFGYTIKYPKTRTLQ